VIESVLVELHGSAISIHEPQATTLGYTSDTGDRTPQTGTLALECTHVGFRDGTQQLVMLASLQRKSNVGTA